MHRKASEQRGFRHTILQHKLQIQYVEFDSWSMLILPHRANHIGQITTNKEECRDGPL